MIFLLGYLFIGFVLLVLVLALNRKYKWMTKDGGDDKDCGAVFAFITLWPVVLFISIIAGIAVGLQKFIHSCLPEK